MATPQKHGNTGKTTRSQIRDARDAHVVARKVSTDLSALEKSTFALSMKEHEKNETGKNENTVLPEETIQELGIYY